MKREIKHPDGRVETVEGTAEELAEYERKVREEGKTEKDARKVLLDGLEKIGLDAIKKAIEDVKNVPTFVPIYIEPVKWKRSDSWFPKHPWYPDSPWYLHDDSEWQYKVVSSNKLTLTSDSSC